MNSGLKKPSNDQKLGGDENAIKTLWSNISIIQYLVDVILLSQISNCTMKVMQLLNFFYFITISTISQGQPLYVYLHTDTKLLLLCEKMPDEESQEGA